MEAQTLASTAFSSIGTESEVLSLKTEVTGNGNELNKCLFLLPWLRSLSLQSLLPSRGRQGHSSWTPVGRQDQVAQARSRRIHTANGPLLKAKWVCLSVSVCQLWHIQPSPFQRALCRWHPSVLVLFMWTVNKTLTNAGDNTNWQYM